MKRQIRTVYALVMLLVMLVIAGCGGSGSNGGGSGASQGGGGTKQVIKFADVQWQSLWINNGIAQFIIEKGYGYPTQSVEMTTPIMQQAIVKGDVDVVTEIWTATLTDWWKEVLEKEQVVDLGTMMDRSAQGWYVPDYVVKGDEARGIKPMAPDLKSVEDLKKYPKVFADPEDPNKGLLINCITGWDCAKINAIKLKAYGLDAMYNMQEPGAAAALDAAIAGAYKQGKPFLAYYWEPTWLVGTYPMIMLEEPAYSEACNDEIQKALKDEISIDQVTANAGCAYEAAPVLKAMNPKLKDRAPDVVTFLEKYTIKTDDLNKVSAYMESEKATAEQAARYYLKNYPDEWKKWVPADVAQKVEAALKE